MSAALRVAAPRNGRLFGRLAASAATVPTASPRAALQAAQRLSVSQPLALGCSARSSSSNSRWKMRQGADFYAQKAKVQGLKSRAAFKLLEIDSKYRLFRGGQTVVDLGYAPGSWSQIALDRTKPNGRIVGIDLIPAQPPKGVSTIQGNFLSPAVQDLVKDYLVEFAGNKLPTRPAAVPADRSEVDPEDVASLIRDKPSYIDSERAEAAWPIHYDPYEEQENLRDEGRLVDIVLSDMMMNTSGMAFRDHAGSMDLCLAALQFASDTLRPGGHFVCKFYAGAEDKQLEEKLKKMFGKVHREKPDSSRSESREAYFVALRRHGDVTLADVE